MQQRIDQHLAILQDPIGAAKDGLSAAWDAVKSGAARAAEVAGPMWEATKAAALSTGQAINERVIQPAASWLDEKREAAMGYLRDKFPGMMACFESFQAMANDAVSFLKEKAQAAGAWVSEHYSKLSMAGHLLLDGLGMIPAFGAIADGLNAVWYLAEGNYTDAAMSALAAVPAIGDAAAAAKLAKKATTVGDVVKAVDKVDDVAGGVRTALTAADAVSDANKAASPVAKAVQDVNQVRSKFDEFVPRNVQNVLMKRQDELQAGAEFTSSTVSDIQTALEENGGELKPGQLGES